MTLITALGKCEFRKDRKGNKIPYLIAEDIEYEPDPWEMILWSSLIWNIRTFSETSRIFYQNEREAHILGDHSCEHYVDRLKSKGFLAEGTGITGMDALHDLLIRLYVIPVRAGLIAKTAAFLDLTFLEGIPFGRTRRIFENAKMEDGERTVWRLVKQNRLSVGEIIRCVDCGIIDVKTDQKIVDGLYTDDDITYRTIGEVCRLSDAHIPVLAAVAELYLKKQIILAR